MEQFYREEMDYVKSGFLWPRFDDKMKTALQYQARQRAEKLARLRINNEKTSVYMADGVYKLPPEPNK